MKIAAISDLNFICGKMEMLNRILPFFVVLFLSTITVQANPINPRSLLAVSEVYLQSPTEWYIEIDIKNNSYWCNFPCSTSAFRLKLSSLKDT